MDRSPDRSGESTTAVQAPRKAFCPRCIITAVPGSRLGSRGKWMRFRSETSSEICRSTDPNSAASCDTSCNRLHCPRRASDWSFSWSYGPRNPAAYPHVKLVFHDRPPYGSLVFRGPRFFCGQAHTKGIQAVPRTIHPLPVHQSSACYDRDGLNIRQHQLSFGRWPPHHQKPAIPVRRVVLVRHCHRLSLVRCSQPIQRYVVSVHRGAPPSLALQPWRLAISGKLCKRAAAAPAGSGSLLVVRGPPASWPAR